MIFIMGDIGAETIQTIRALPAAKKWDFVDGLLQEAGFDGIALTDSLYARTLGMPFDDMPNPMHAVKLTYHLDATYTLVSQDDLEAFQRTMNNALSLAREHGISDISILPPTLPAGMLPLRGFMRERFQEALLTMMARFAWAGAALSLESRVQGAQSLFQGLADYANFVASTKGLGALIHVAEHCYDGYSENDLLELLRPLRVTGLRIGDADPALPREEGIGLPVGSGTVGLKRFLAPYADAPIYGVVSMNTSFEEIKNSVKKLNKYIAP